MGSVITLQYYFVYVLTRKANGGFHFSSETPGAAIPHVFPP
jgi:hypothetical protein